MTAQSRRAADDALDATRKIMDEWNAHFSTMLAQSWEEGFRAGHGADAADTLASALTAAHAAGLREGVESVLALPKYVFGLSVFGDEDGDDRLLYVNVALIRALLSPPPAGGDGNDA